LRSELKAGFTRGLGQGLDAAVVRKTGAVERNLFDAGGLGPFGDALADDRSCRRRTRAPSSEMMLA
jgi:hypothetical protein